MHLFRKTAAARVKRALPLGGAALFAFVSGALAADLPSIKGPPVYAPPPPTLSWTGFYAGINGGYAGDRVAYDRYGGHSGLTEAQAVTSGGFLGGGELGFNYQFAGSNFVIGGETDFEGSTVKAVADEVSPSGYSNAVAAPNATKLDWLGTARARLGMAFGNVLPYVTGGFAYGHLDQYRSESGTSPYDNWSIGSTATGWTAGAGIEYAITRNLSVKTEYLFVDLGKRGYQTPYDVLNDPTVEHTSHLTLNVVRAGLNWKFDWVAPPTTPVAPKY